jgi:hypothetical protein
MSDRARLAAGKRRNTFSSGSPTYRTFPRASGYWRNGISIGQRMLTDLDARKAKRPPQKS